MINNKESQKKEVLVVFVRAGFNFNEKQVLVITSVSSSEHSYLQFTFDFMTLTQNFNISYFEQKENLILVNL